jgi:exodeoxyribonuclease VIII
MLKPTVIDWGRMRYKRALATFAECMKSGVWPGYPDDTIEADLPVWAEKGLQARHERGEFSEGIGQ